MPSTSSGLVREVRLEPREQRPTRTARRLVAGAPFCGRKFSNGRPEWSATYARRASYDARRGRRAAAAAARTPRARDGSRALFARAAPDGPAAFRAADAPWRGSTAAQPAVGAARRSGLTDGARLAQRFSASSAAPGACCSHCAHWRSLTPTAPYQAVGAHVPPPLDRAVGRDGDVGDRPLVLLVAGDAAVRLQQPRPQPPHALPQPPQPLLPWRERPADAFAAAPRAARRAAPAAFAFTLCRTRRLPRARWATSGLAQ